MGRSSKDRRDIFYRLAKEEGWRARSAFKLLHIDSYFKIFDGVTRAVDLCAAPGSWSQVLAQQLRKNKQQSSIPLPPETTTNNTPTIGMSGFNSYVDEKITTTTNTETETYIVAVDLQTMSPIPGVTCLKGDITEEKTANEIIKHLGNTKSQLVVCDGAPDVTGLHQLDEFLQAQLLYSALSIATLILEENGTFVAKIFRASRDGVETIFSRLKMFFEDVIITKPRSSRASSIESFVVCQKFKLPDGFTPGYINPFSKDFGTLNLENRYPLGRLIIKFVACGDLNGFDSDTTYQYNSKLRPSLPPVQPPINPPYAEALRRRKAGLLGLTDLEIMSKQQQTHFKSHHPKSKNKINNKNDNIENNEKLKDIMESPSRVPSSPPILTNSIIELTQTPKDHITKKIYLNFGGGAEKLVGDRREIIINIPCDDDYDKNIYNMTHLLEWIKINLISERPELLIQDGNIRPGILVLINDMDWELLGNMKYELIQNDKISFISTLHGG